MRDIFDAGIVCKKCNKEMKHGKIEKNGFVLRVVRCGNCKDEIVHPADLVRYNHYKDMKGRTYNVKLRVVGNSHAISIPKEVLDFVNEMHRDMKSHMDDVVKLAFEDFGKLSVRFFGDEVYKERTNGKRFIENNREADR